MAGNGTATLNITATVNATGDYSNYAQIATSDQLDPDSTSGDDSIGDDDDDTVNITPNDFPTTIPNPDVQLDDDALPGGIAGGIGDVDPDTPNTVGTVGFTFGGDGPGSIDWLTTGAPAGFTYELSGSDLLVKQSTTTLITATLNSLTGAYTITHNAPIPHADGNDENDQSFLLIILNWSEAT